MGDFKIIDENNVEREATVITVIEVDGKDYLVYSIDRDHENVNIFASLLKKDMNGNDIIVDIEFPITRIKSLYVIYTINPIIADASIGFKIWSLKFIFSFTSLFK